MRCCAIVFLCLLAACHGLAAEKCIPQVVTVRQVLDCPPAKTQTVCIVGQAIRAIGSRGRFILRDETGGIPVMNFCNQGIFVANGDYVRVTGHIGHPNRGLPWFFDTAIKVLRHGTQPESVAAEPADILRGACNYHPVAVEGVVTDVFSDDADPHRLWVWFLIEQSGVKVPCTYYSRNHDRTPIERLVNATVRVTGMAEPDITQRGFMRAHISLSSFASLEILEPPPEDPFICEPFDSLPRDRLEFVRKFAHRRRLTGRLIASWGNRNFFVRLDNEHNIRVRLGQEQSLPVPNTRVTVAGFLRKNAFFAWFDNALLRVDASPSEPLDAPGDVDLDRIFPADGNPAINSALNGTVIRIIGRVRNISRPGTTQGRFEMDAGRTIIPVEIGMALPPAIGSEVEVTGACIIESATEDADSLFTRIQGIVLVPRTPADIRILRAPPWWTQTKLLTVIGALLLGLGAILVWNLALKRVSDRKSHELLREQKTRLEAQLRIDERTRLAVELHDSLAQNLTGISLQLDAAEMASQTGDAEAGTFLQNARNALRSCREGLRYCLSDLRSRTFEDGDMTEALLATIRPHVGKARLAVRFNVPRAWFSDTSVHAVLCIARELAVNAVRHGHATEILVAGECADGCVRFSVKDNGCGFDPKTCPGSAQGHFGLMGIRERIQNFKGTISIDSRPSAGSKITVALKIPEEDCTSA